MSQDLSGIDRSFIAGDTLTAYRVVALATTTANTVNYWDTTTAVPIGATLSKADSGTAVPVRLFGTAKLIAANSITTGTLLMAQTATGAVLTATATLGTTTARSVIGIAVEPSDTNSAVEVVLMPQFIPPVTLAA